LPVRIEGRQQVGFETPVGCELVAREAHQPQQGGVQVELARLAVVAARRPRELSGQFRVPGDRHQRNRTLVRVGRADGAMGLPMWPAFLVEVLPVVGGVDDQHIVQGQ